MPPPFTKLPRQLHNLHQFRSFVDARVKWVRDPYLDFAVQREKDLQQAVSLKDHIVSTPSRSLPLSTASLLKSDLHLPTSTSSFSLKYPSFFTLFRPRSNLPPHLKLTPQALGLNKEESAIHSCPIHRKDAVRRLAKLLMLTRASRLPIYIIEKLKWDMGLPHDYVLTLLADFPEYFQVCEVKDELTGEQVLALELVSWREELAVSELERRLLNGVELGRKKGSRIAFPMSLPRGFDLEKKVRSWVEEWQKLPYISPYENAFHLSPNSDQAEKWTVAVLHELLWLLVSKKTERDIVFCLGEYLGFGGKFKKALVHHPGIFYVSNKIRTQTVVLREAYRKDFLLEKHPLIGESLEGEEGVRKAMDPIVSITSKRMVWLISLKFGLMRRWKLALCLYMGIGSDPRLWKKSRLRCCGYLGWLQQLVELSWKWYQACRKLSYAKEKLVIQKLYRRWLLHLITDKEQLHSEAIGFIWRRNSQKNLRKFRLLLLVMVLASISRTQSKR